VSELFTFFEVLNSKGVTFMEEYGMHAGYSNVNRNRGDNLHILSFIDSQDIVASMIRYDILCYDMIRYDRI